MWYNSISKVKKEGITIACLKRMRIKSKNYSISISNHCFNRVQDRDIEIRNVLSTVSSLSYLKLYEILDNVGEEYALIDYKNNHTVFIGIKTDKINLISILKGVDNHINEVKGIIELNKKGG